MSLLLCPIDHFSLHTDTGESYTAHLLMSVNQLKYYIEVIYGMCQGKNENFDLHRALLINMLYHCSEYHSGWHSRDSERRGREVDARSTEHLYL